MGRFRRSDGPRVVGFDFGPRTGAPAEVPVAAPPAPPAAPPPPPPAFATPEPAFAAGPAYAAAPGYPPPGFPPPPPPPPAAPFAGYAPPAPPSPPAQQAAAFPPPGAAPFAGGYAAPTATLPPPGFDPVATHPAPLPWSPPKSRRRMPRALSGLLVVLVLVGVRAGVRTAIDGQLGSGGRERVTLTTPRTVGSLPRLTTAAAREVELSFAKELPAKHQPQVGVYGRGATGRYLLVAGFSGEETSAQALSEFAKGFAGNGGTVGTPRASAGGLSCAKVTMPAQKLRGSICAWAGSRSNGFVMDHAKTDVAALATVTAKARAQVDGR